MKKLEELGISPAPWNKVLDEFGDEECQYQVAVADARFPVGAVTLSGNYCEADSCLIAAAPEMYEALRCSTNFIEHTVQFVENEDIKNELRKIADKNKSALAKASGEGEVAK